jgi:hypothetical protein
MAKELDLAELERQVSARLLTNQECVARLAEVLEQVQVQVRVVEEARLVLGELLEQGLAEDSPQVLVVQAQLVQAMALLDHLERVVDLMLQQRQAQAVAQGLAPVLG